MSEVQRVQNEIEEKNREAVEAKGAGDMALFMAFQQQLLALRVEKNILMRGE